MRDFFLFILSSCVFFVLVCFLSFSIFVPPFMSPRFEWQDVTNQSACADETRCSFQLPVVADSSECFLSVQWTRTYQRGHVDCTWERERENKKILLVSFKHGCCHTYVVHQWVEHSAYNRLIGHQCLGCFAEQDLCVCVCVCVCVSGCRFIKNDRATGQAADVVWRSGEERVLRDVGLGVKHGKVLLLGLCTDEMSEEECNMLEGT